MKSLSSTYTLVGVASSMFASSKLSLGRSNTFSYQAVFPELTKFNKV